MNAANSTPAVFLIAMAEGRHLPCPPGTDGDSVMQVPTGALALECAHELRPDLIVLDAVLPDMDALDAARWLLADPRIGQTVPILILTDGQPTPARRIEALSAGVWDFVGAEERPDEFVTKVRIYVRAKRNVDAVIGAAPLGVLSRPQLARRARELGSLMARMRGGLACLVAALDTSLVDPPPAAAIVRGARVSDTVGALGSFEVAILAPATDRVGAVKLAHRIAGSVRDAMGKRGPLPEGALRIGYDAVANVTYASMDPVDLITRASVALRSGVAEPGHDWLRRFDPSAAPSPPARPSPPGVTLSEAGGL